MSLFAVEKPTPVDQKQSRLMQLAAAFLFLYSITLTLSPVVRLHSWQGEYRWSHWIGFAVWLVCAALVNQQLTWRLPERDPYLLPVGALLAGWGVLSIWRLDFTNGARQTIWLAIGFAVLAAGLRIPDFINLLRRYKYVWLTAGLLLTGLTFILGVYPGGVGPRLWLGCCGVYLQPSEPLKLLLIIYLAAYLADRLPVAGRLESGRNLFPLLFPTLVMIGLALALLVGQRDLGTASLFILIYTVIIYVASQKRRMLFISLLVLVAAGVTGYLLFDVVRLRVDAWINPWIDPAGRSYQIIQSLLAVASGGFLGRGPGLGNPGVVPVSHSDFIFASLAEETGLAGAVGLFLLFALLVGRGLRAALGAPSNFRRYLAAGITAYLVMQAIFIIGGNLRILPLTGVTLPFVSYGGSSLLTAFISLLILLLVSSQDPEDIAPLSSPTPYLVTGTGLMAALLLLALATGWWAVVRAPALVARPENPRRVITERYVPRGSLLDRNNTPISRTTGTPGNFQRNYEYPELSATAGYNSSLYGQSGLEAGLDDYLRGLRGNLDTLVWLENLLYGQTPRGLDVRLSIDLELQKEADTLLEGKKGALVLLNPETGEILAMASHPNVNANQLEANWMQLLQDPDAPLLNRATQGSYPPGAALGPFLLAYASQQGALPALPQANSYTAQGVKWNCAQEPSLPAKASGWVASGCPAELVALGQQIGAKGLADLFTSLGFYSTPALPLEMASPSLPVINRVDMAAIGQENLSVTPLQMALAAASISSGGMRPAPLLAASILTPDRGWVAQHTAGGEETLLTGSGSAAAAEALAVKDSAYWQVVALARSSREDLTWYVGGTLPNSTGASLALALVLEERNPDLAVSIGQALLDTAQK